MASETARTEAFSDGVFAIAIFFQIVLNMLLAVFFALPPSIMRRK